MAEKLRHLRNISNNYNHLDFLLNCHEIIESKDTGKVLKKSASIKAMDQANCFIKEMKDTPFKQRQDFVKLFIEIREKEEFNLYLPFPVLQKIILPTIKEWLAIEPNNPQIYIYIARHFISPSNQYDPDLPAQWDIEAYQKALELDPSNNQVRSIIINSNIDSVYFWLHHIFDKNGGIITVSSEEAIDSCDQLIIECDKLDDLKLKNKYIQDIMVAKAMVQDWIDYEKTTRKITFLEYCQQLGRKYPGMDFHIEPIFFDK